MEIVETLGLHWERDKTQYIVPHYSVERVCFRFRKMLPEFVWDASFLEGNPLSFTEVQTLLDGVTVGGHKLVDQQQVLNLLKASKHLLSLLKAGEFALSRPVFMGLNGLIAREETLEWGCFRGEGGESSLTPHIGCGEYRRYAPLPTRPGAAALVSLFDRAVRVLESEYAPFERGIAFFLFGALQKFFFSGNRRTSQLMMNGILMSHGMDAITVPAGKAQDFDEKMMRFYTTQDATEMMQFIADCHPQARLAPSSR